MCRVREFCKSLLTSERANIQLGTLIEGLLQPWPLLTKRTDKDMWVGDIMSMVCQLQLLAAELLPKSATAQSPVRSQVWCARTSQCHEK